MVELLPDADARWQYLANDAATFYFLTTKDAPRGRIVAVDLHDPVPRELVAQSADPLDMAAFFGQRIVASYLHDARARVVVYALDGSRLAEVALPGLGSVAGFGGKRTARETFYSYTSYTEPTSIYRYDVERNASTRVFAPQVGFDHDAFASEQVFYTSKDGTRVPMILTYRKGTPRDGSAPTLLYGYGGFDISLTPAFSSAVLVWLEMGGVYAVPNLRGGGEYGEAWHRAGIMERKQNVFDDFIAAAEWLVAQRWTSPAKLAIHGGSNGGLLVGACMTQRPELFGAALPAVGVLDMLRFQMFTIGWAWTSDYGSSDDPAEFRTLLAYSPYHNLRAGVRLPGHADHHRRPRRPRLPGPLVQVRRGAAARAGRRRAGAAAGRDQGRPRRRQADREGDRRDRRPLRVPGQDAGDAPA